VNRQLIAVAALCAVSLLAPASAQDSGSADIAEAQSVAATEAASRNEFRSLDKDVQDLKKEVLDLNRDLFLLEEELLFPANSQVAFFVSMDEMDLGRTEITGNQELPKVLYIVPWQKSDPGELMGRPVNTLLDEVLAPLNRDEFVRQVDYYGELYGVEDEE